MIIDKLLSPAVELALSTFTVSTQVIGDVMDLGVARSNGLLSNPYGPGFDIKVRDATSGGAATLALQLVTDDNAALSSATVLYTVTGLALVTLDEYDLWVPLPDLDTYERYLAWRAVVGTAVYTGGTMSIQYVANKRRWRAYPSQGNA